MPRVIVLDNIAQEGLDLLESTDGFEYEVRTKLSGDDLKEALAGADGAILRSGVTITPESLEGNKRLKAIVRAGVGTDNIDKEAATRGGIVVMNTPKGMVTIMKPKLLNIRRTTDTITVQKKKVFRKTMDMDTVKNTKKAKST